MNKDQLRDLIVRVLKTNNLIKYDDEREVDLLMVTAAVESNLGEYIRQAGGGPALGIFQMEPTTHNDIWDNYLRGNDELEYYLSIDGSPRLSFELEWDLSYAIEMARVHYLRVPEALPEKGDYKGQVTYWKKYWNTEKGKGTIEDALEKYFLFLT